MNTLDLIIRLHNLYFKHGNIPCAVQLGSGPRGLPGPWHDVTGAVVDTDDGWEGVVIKIDPVFGQQEIDSIKYRSIPDALTAEAQKNGEYDK